MEGGAGPRAEGGAGLHRAGVELGDAAQIDPSAAEQPADHRFAQAVGGAEVGFNFTAMAAPPRE